MLPFDIVEDPIFQWAYDAACKNRAQLSALISEIAANWRAKIRASLKGKHLCVMLDGKTKTLRNLLLKMPITEAAVEIAFSRHKLFHNKLRASLANEKLDDQLYIRYNFGKIMKIAAREQSTDVNLEIEIIL